MSLNEWHLVKASSFADPVDIIAFKRCKAKGYSDQHCFKFGDNGIGKWGDDTTQAIAMCALPPDDWKRIENPRLKKVTVEYKDRSITCLLADTMPWKKNIKNGAGIDLNPEACKLLGRKPPIMLAGVRWKWE